MPTRKFNLSIVNLVVASILGLLLICFNSPITIRQGLANDDETSVSAKPSEAENVIFRSGFEPPVKIEPPVDRGTDEWFQFITGADEGYQWPTEAPGANRFQYVVASKANLDDYVETRIDSVIGHDGKPTQALFMKVKTYSKNDFGIARFGYVRSQYKASLNSNFQQAYARYWMKLQPDLETLMPEGESTWRILMEWWEGGISGDDLRYQLTISRHPRTTKQLYWNLRGQTLLPKTKTVFFRQNLEAPVPVGEWFLLEVFWKHSSDGHIWVAVNGETVIDYRGQTKKDSNLRIWHIFKVYAEKKSLDKSPAYQWIDDIEIRTDIPEPPVREVEFNLSLPKGASLINIPIKVNRVGDSIMQIRTIGDFYTALGGKDNAEFIVTDQLLHSTGLRVWRSYIGDISRGSPADQTITDDMGIISVMKHPVTLRLKGEALGIDGISQIHLQPGNNLIGLPLMDNRLKRVSDLLNLEGIKDNATAIVVMDANDGEFKVVSRPGDDGDLPITGGQSFIITVRAASTVEIRGEAWDNPQ